MQVGSHGPDRHAEGIGNLLIAAFFLMIEDENGSLDVAESLELLFDGLLKLALFYLLFGIAVGMGEPILPTGRVVGQRDVGAVVAAASLPLVLRNVDGNSVEIGGDEGFPAKAGEGAIEPKEDVLGEVIDVLATAGEPQKGAEDHLLMVAYHLLEGEIGVQAGLDHRVRLKFHACQ